MLAALCAAALLLRVVQGGGLGFSVAEPCGGGTYFDAASLTCATCAVPGVAGRQPTNGSLTQHGSPRGCGCAQGYTVVPRVCDPATTAPCASDACSACPANQTSSRDGSACLPCGSAAAYAGPGLDCVCPANHALVERSSVGLLLAAKACTPCPPRGRLFLAPTGAFPGDAYACAACADPRASVTAAGTCACDAGYTPAGLGGALGASSAAGAAGLECVPSAAAALAATAYPGATTQTFHELGLSSVSLVFSALFPSALAGCRAYAGGDAASARHCQALANLCALTYANPAHDACRALGALASARGASAAHTAVTGWAAGFPLLTWGLNAATLAGDSASLPASMVFAGANPALNTFSQLRFYLAQYTLNGTFVGLRRLRSQLAYCAARGGAGGAGDAAPLPPWQTFGHGWSERSTCDLGALLGAGAAGAAGAAPALALKEPVFYDLYVQDLSADGGPGAGGKGVDGGGGGASLLASALAAAAASGVLDPTRLPLTLVPVPVRVTNYVAAGGARPNANTWSGGEADDVFTGRFTLLDAASGASAQDGLPPAALRYAAAVTLTMYSLASPTATSMALPVLTITYAERSLASALAAPLVPVAFAVEYTRLSYAPYVSALTGLGIFLVLCVALWAWGATVAHLRMNARTALEGAITAPVMLRWVVNLVSGYAVASYWFIIVFSFYWLVFFKLQNSPFSLMPLSRPAYADDPYLVLYGFMVSTLVCYLLRVAHLIYAQVTCDVFFVDWEKANPTALHPDLEVGAKGAAAGQRPALGGGSTSAGAGAGSGSGSSATSSAPAPAQGVSAWRTIYALNEWAALGSDRRCLVPLTLVALVALLEGAGLKYVATPQPFSADLAPQAALNRALAFANSMFWYWVVAGSQFALVRFVWEHFIAENPLVRFVDLCTIMKVSLLLMDQRYRGFYIHANAPHEYADGSLTDITRHLHEEAANMRSGRGIPGCPDPLCQTFEVHVPFFWRERYDRVFRRLLDLAAGGEGGGGEGGYSLGFGGFGGSGGSGGGGGGGGGGSGGSARGGDGGLPSKLARAVERTRALQQGQQQLSRFLKDFVEESDPEFKRFWKERDVAHSALGIPPDMHLLGQAESAAAALGGGGGGGGGLGGLGATLGRGGGGTATGGDTGTRFTFMYTDLRFRFEGLLFRGIEFDLLCLESLLFCVISDSLGGHAALAAVYAYACSFALAFVRSHYGKKNLSFKTLVDESFIGVKGL